MPESDLLFHSDFSLEHVVLNFLLYYPRGYASQNNFTNKSPAKVFFQLPSFYDTIYDLSTQEVHKARKSAG